MKDMLIAHMDTLRNPIFQLGEAPYNRVASVTYWLADNNIEVLGPWSGSSSDPNPIKNL